jgi:hypothetical protein
MKKAFQDLDNKTYESVKRRVGFSNPNMLDELFLESTVSEDAIREVSEKYLKQWSDKRDLGTAFHKKKEDEDHANGFCINPFTGKKHEIITWKKNSKYDNESYPGELIDIPDGYVAEHLIKNDEYGVAGQIDKNFIETINGVRYVDIDDWKTDGKVEKRPFFHPKQGYRTMKKPFDHMYDTNYWQYACKISTYAKMLELEGFTVRNLAITSVEIDENLEIINEARYILPYKSFEVDIIFKIFNEDAQF